MWNILYKKKLKSKKKKKPFHVMDYEAKFFFIYISMSSHEDKRTYYNFLAGMVLKNNVKLQATCSSSENKMEDSVQ